MYYAYPCVLQAEEEGGFSVFFPDLPEALTCGKDRHTALEMAEDALIVALSGRIADRNAIPVPSAALPEQHSIALPPLLAAKLALYNAIRNQGITQVALAARMNVSESVVRKLLDPAHRSHIDNVVTALRVLGRNLLTADRATLNPPAPFSCPHRPAAPSPQPRRRPMTPNT